MTMRGPAPFKSHRCVGGDILIHWKKIRLAATIAQAHSDISQRLRFSSVASVAFEPMKRHVTNNTQTCPEVMVVWNGSCDGAIELAPYYQEPRVFRQVPHGAIGVREIHKGQTRVAHSRHQHGANVRRQDDFIRRGHYYPYDDKNSNNNALGRHVALDGQKKSVNVHHQTVEVRAMAVLVPSKRALRCTRSSP